MARIAGKREVYWSVLGISLLPGFLYVSDILGVLIEPSAMWFPVYVLGIIPVIVTDLAVSQFLPGMQELVIMFLFYLSVQILFAFVLAGVSAAFVRTERPAVGEIRADSRKHVVKRTIRFLVYLYAGLFLIYWLVSLLLAT